MTVHLLKVVVSLLCAIWVGIVVAQIVKQHDDDWPQGGAAA